MQIIIEDNRTLRLAQVFEHHEKIIANKFSVKDPNARYARAMSSGWWDGVHRFYDSKNQRLQKGYLQELILLCNENDIPFDLKDMRDKPKYIPPPPKSFDNKLVEASKNGREIIAHKHQMRCWNSVCMSTIHPVFEIGTHSHPTGAGKSLMMAGIVKLFRCPTVILTEQTVVLNQIVESLKLFNVVHYDDIGEFYSGKMPDGNLVCVGSIAALQKPKKPILGKIDVKIKALKYEFEQLNKKDSDKLKSIITYHGYLAWKRSDVIDFVNATHSSKKTKDKVKDLVPSQGKWDESFDSYVYDVIDEMFIKDKAKLVKIIGKEYADDWEKSKIISDSYQDHLISALSRFKEVIRHKYFLSCKKAYDTLKVKVADLHEMIGKCDLLLIDEMDNAASDNYKILFDQVFSGRYIHGFSGTPYDPSKPVEKMKLLGRFGSVMSRSTRRELEKIEQIQPVKYIMRQFGEIDPKNKTAFDIAERRIIIENEDFHSEVVNTINGLPDDRHLIIVDTSNIEELGKALEEKIESSAFMWHKVSNSKRTKIIKDFENGVIRTLIVSKVGKRGMDLGGGCDTLHIIGGGKQQSNFDQIIGRAVRKSAKGWSRVIDYYFTGNKHLLDHSRAKLRHIVGMGYTAHIVLGSEIMKAEDFIRSRYKLPTSFLASKC